MTKTTKIDISVVIPVHNEELHLDKLYERLDKTLKSMKKSYEVIFIDDGSTDKSLSILEKIHKQDENVKVVQLSRNFGQHPAVTAGFKISRGNIIVTIDADLQNPPEEIPKLVAKSEEGFGVVSGKRLNRKDNADRLFVSKLGNIMISKLTGIKLNDYGCMMRSYSREVVEQVLMCPEKFKAIPALIAWLSPSSIVEVEIEHDSRMHGKSNYTIYDLIRLAFGLLVGYSTVPLQLISFFGILSTLAGFFGLIYLLFSYLFNGGLPSTIFIFSSLFLLFYGILIFAIGFVGEYVGRIFVEVQGRPYYIVKKILNH